MPRCKIVADRIQLVNERVKYAIVKLAILAWAFECELHSEHSFDGYISMLSGKSFYFIFV